MTNEEAIKIIKAECYVFNPLNLDRTQMVNTALDTACKALEQEPCEDAISRQAVLSMQYRIDDSATLSSRDVVNVDDIEDLPPVTPQSKTGLWIKSRDSYGNNHFTCPFCEHDIATKYAGTWEDNYCSNCGARLESEDKK